MEGVIQCLGCFKSSTTEVNVVAFNVEVRYIPFNIRAWFAAEGAVFDLFSESGEHVRCVYACGMVHGIRSAASD